MIRKGLLLSLIPLAVLLAFGLWGYTSAPVGEFFPVHWGIDGKPDRYGGALEAFFAMVAIGVLVTSICAVVPLLDPRGDNIRKSEPFYLTVWMAVLWFFAVLQGAMTLSALGYLDMGDDMFIRIGGTGLAVLFAVIGNVLGKSQPNWFAGVRTPWTLSSDLSWEKTHRLTGRLFVLFGIAGVAGAWLLPATLVMPSIVVGVLAASVISVVYSWMVWRTAPDRRNGSPAA